VQGVSTIIVAVLIVVISTVTAISAYSWAAPNVALSFDLSESQAVQAALESCNDRILETARTGSANQCAIPASRGVLTAKTDGLYYSLISAGHICDPSVDWIIIDADDHIEQMCNQLSQNATELDLRWRFPKQLNVQANSMTGNLSRDTTITPVDFADTNFRTVSVFVYMIVSPGGGGQNVELTRKDITTENVTLGVRIY
jgi:hypothetical protein